MTPTGDGNFERLPSGRHGLTREAVERSQRERMLRSILAAVSDKGYGATSVADVIAGAGVSRTTFYEFWKDKEGCFLAAYDAVIEVLLTRVEAAYAEPGPWPERVRAGLAAFLHWLVTYPDLARVAVIEAMAAGPRATERYREAVRRFTPFFEEGRRQAPHADELPAGVPVVVVGGIAAIVFDEVVAGRTAELGEVLPELVYSALAPFLGHDQALDEMDKPALADAG
ncbi:MAG: TetR/AcrR family transcriptional regulator [Thermoleophilaceae bacterium]